MAILLQTTETHTTETILRDLNGIIVPVHPAELKLDKDYGFTKERILKSKDLWQIIHDEKACLHDEGSAFDIYKENADSNMGDYSAGAPVLHEDDFASQSPFAVPSQRSTRLYVRRETFGTNSFTWYVDPDAVDKTAVPDKLLRGTPTFGSLQVALDTSADYKGTALTIIIKEGTVEEDININFRDLEHILIKGEKDYSPNPDAKPLDLLTSSKAVIKGRINFNRCKLPKFENILWDVTDNTFIVSRCTSAFGSDYYIYSSSGTQFAFEIKASILDFQRILIFGQKGLRIHEGSIIKVFNAFKIVLSGTVDSELALLVESASNFSMASIIKRLENGKVTVKQNSNIVSSNIGAFIIQNEALTGAIKEGLIIQDRSSIFVSKTTDIKGCVKSIVVNTGSAFESNSLILDHLPGDVVVEAISILNLSFIRIKNRIYINKVMPTILLRADNSNAYLEQGFIIKKITTDDDSTIQGINGSLIEVKDDLDIESSVTANVNIIYSPSLNTSDSNNSRTLEL